jgi:chromosome segregation ATPase
MDYGVMDSTLFEFLNSRNQIESRLRHQESELSGVRDDISVHDCVLSGIEGEMQHLASGFRSLSKEFESLKASLQELIAVEERLRRIDMDLKGKADTLWVKDFKRIFG